MSFLCFQNRRKTSTKTHRLRQPPRCDHCLRTKWIEEAKQNKKQKRTNKRNHLSSIPENTTLFDFHTLSRDHRRCQPSFLTRLSLGCEAENDESVGWRAWRLLRTCVTFVGFVFRDRCHVVRLVRSLQWLSSRFHWISHPEYMHSPVTEKREKSFKKLSDLYCI